MIGPIDSLESNRRRREAIKDREVADGMMEADGPCLFIALDMGEWVI